MPALRKLPPAHELRQLRLKGLKLKEIAEMYNVTEPAVWRALERGGMVEIRSSAADMLPWKILPQHKTTAVMERFRTMLKQKNEQAITVTEQRLLDEWLLGLQQNGVVVNYHPDAPPNDASSKGGFYYVPRLPEDKWIIREPA